MSVRTESVGRAAAAVAVVFALSAVATSAPAFSPFGHLLGKPRAQPAALGEGGAAIADQVRQALDERRYIDAGNLLAKAKVQNISSPRLTVLTGELMLARGQIAEARTTFHSVLGDPAARPSALEGEGLALSLLGKSDEAMADLKQATVLDKTQWRAWNGLGREYDMRKDWKQAEAAYAQALAAPGANAAIVLNNRGYSHLLQKQNNLAIADFVSALDKDPALAAARTNLRITMAIDGRYDRASVTGVGDDRAAVLNNVGLAAAIRGDYDKAAKLLNEAIDAKGKYYERATDNLELTRQLQARAQDIPSMTDAAIR
jgi:tetratricopeptide (TPR) repeat protein